MEKAGNRNGFSFDRPGKYRVVVEGVVNESWAERLGGMKIDTCTHWDNRQITTLVGEMIDQAALSGVLNTLYEAHLTLLSVEFLKNNEYTP